MMFKFVLEKVHVLDLIPVNVILDTLEIDVKLKFVLEKNLQILKFVTLMDLVLDLTLVNVQLDIQELNVN